MRHLTMLLMTGVLSASEGTTARAVRGEAAARAFSRSGVMLTHLGAFRLLVAAALDGSVVIPAGADADVMLVESNDTPGAATFRLARVSIGGELRHATTDVARADAPRSGLSTGTKTGLGAVAGAVLGVVTGGSLLKGAIVGAGGGLAWGLLDHGTPRVVQGQQATAAVALYRALGGGWPVTPADSARQR